MADAGSELQSARLAALAEAWNVVLELAGDIREKAPRWDDQYMNNDIQGEIATLSRLITALEYGQDEPPTTPVRRS
jgi:hypothetical protein